MSSAHKIALLIDGNALIHRAWHALPPMYDPAGHVVSAVYGFASILLKLLPQEHPDYLIVCWDTEAPTYRHTALESYKAHRTEQPKEFYDQFEGAKQVVSAFGGFNVEEDGFEADDVIATFAKRFASQGVRVTILTSDRDIWQLISDKIHVLSFKKGVSETLRIDPEVMRTETGLEPSQWVDFKSLRGDASDNLKGVPGIGEKTATELLQQFGNLDRILESAQKGTGQMTDRVRKLLTDGKKDAVETKKLVELQTNAKMESIDHYVRPAVDSSELVSLFTRYGFKSLVTRVAKQGEKEPRERSTRSVKKSETEVSNAAPYVTHGVSIKSIFDAEVVWRILDKQTDVVVRVQSALQGSLLGENEGLVFAFENAAYFFPTSIIQSKEGKKWFESFFQNAKIKKHGHGLKIVFHWALDRGWEMAGLGLDTEIAAYLLSAGEGSYELASLASALLQEQIPTDEIPALPEASVIWKLQEKLEKELRIEDLWKVYEELELPIISLLAHMEREGICIDREHFRKLTKVFRQEKEKIEEEMQKLAGREFNPASTQQLAVVLFEDLKLPIKGIKRGKTGYSTAASEMEKLEGQHPIIEKVTAFREVAKLLSTYVEVLPDLADANGRIHTTYHQTIAATGRLSSADPNLQNIPTRTELGKQIRRGFIAKPGFVLLSCDYSQIELRIVAAMAKDAQMLKAFQEGQDIHTATAAQILGIPMSDVKPEQRRAAKAVNFGILYGQGPVALARATQMTFQEAKGFIQKYFELYGGVKAYLEYLKQEASEKGFVMTLFGRRRPIVDIDSPIPQIRAAAERMAMNMPIQGTEADLVKLAMIAVAKELPKISERSRMLLQVHDELVFEVPKSEVKQVAREIERVMRQVAGIGCPIVVESKAGENWADESSI